jgi:drug/metabolite transporter (DMT)-like permease
MLPFFRVLPCAGELLMKMAGIALIVIGLAIIIWGAFGFKTREKVVDVGPIHATKETEHNVPYGPIAGAVVALGGVLLLVKGKG